MKWVWRVLGVAALLGVLAWYFEIDHDCGRHERFTTIRPTRGFCRSPEWPAHTCLKHLASVQEDFRANDRDGDGKANFWRADIAGLYALAPGGGPAIKLLSLSIAAADDRSVVDLSPYAVLSQKAGYWFRAIRHADEDPQALSPDRFAACAYPDSPSSGKYIFVIDENNTVFRSVAGGRRGIEVFPTEEELRTSWSKLD